MRALAQVVRTDLDGWQQWRRRAIATGCGTVLERDSERVAAADELLALALVEFGVIAVCADIADEAARELDAPDGEVRSALASAAAAALRLVDRALAAHGLDAGSTTTAWLDGGSRL